MKELVIISYYYAPANMMGAIRMSKLSKYFADMGYKVTVITSVNNSLLFMKEMASEDPILADDVKGLRILKVSHGYLYSLIAKRIRRKVSTINLMPYEDFNKGLIKKLKKYFMHYGVYFLSLLQDYEFYMQSRKYLNKIKFNDNTVLISTYGPLANHIISRKIINKQNQKVKWIADFRDPIAQPENYGLEHKINKYFEKKICEEASRVVAVSEGYLKSLNMNLNAKGFVITNGYDKSDVKYISEKYRINKLTFVYTGTLYSGKRDLSPLFKVIKELSQSKIIDLANIMFYYAGVEGTHFLNEAKKYGLEKQVCSIGNVSRVESLNLQASADILVAATWNNLKDSGILPGKFLEYMLLNKTVLAFVCGNETNSEIKALIEETKLGVCYEEGGSLDDYELLKTFIINKYEEFIDTSKIKFTGNKRKLEKYCYTAISSEYAELIENI